MEDKIFQLNLRSSGMFSNVNEVIHNLHLAEQGGYRFHIDWRHSCYFEKDHGNNPWTYYFLPCFDLPTVEEVLERLPTGKKVACAKKNIITPRIADGQCAPLLLPEDRNRPAALIEKYLKLQPAVAQIIADQTIRFMDRYMIGLHIRGLGRVHGGAAAIFRNAGKTVHKIDYDRYFDIVNQQLSQQPDAGIFLCSDSQAVIDHTLDVYGDRVYCYDASRSDFGEMHTGHANNAGLQFSPFKLGMDVLVEAYTLASTNHFIHGNSNVANFVLCKNPELEHSYIYQQQMQTLLETTAG